MEDKSFVCLIDHDFADGVSIWGIGKNPEEAKQDAIENIFENSDFCRIVESDPELLKLVETVGGYQAASFLRKNVMWSHKAALPEIVKELLKICADHNLDDKTFSKLYDSLVNIKKELVKDINYDYA